MSKPSEIAIGAIIHEANEWLVRLQDPLSGLQDETDFAHWIQSSPLHVREYLRAESTWVELENIDPERRIDIGKLLCEGTGNVVVLDSSTVDRPRVSDVPSFYSRQRKALVAAVALVTIFIGYTGYQGRMDYEVYETHRGEQRRLVLEDGSIVELNTQSEIRVRLTTTNRNIDFVKGEAFFTVAKDPQRPFIVKSDLAVVRALGTQFNVYRRPDQMLVTVLEGRVTVENAARKNRTHAFRGSPQSNEDISVELAAGHQAKVVTRAAIRTAATDTQRTIAWRKRRLIFENQTLSEVVSEFNRYNNRQMIVRDAALGMKRISGVFDADQPQALIRFLALNASIETIRTNSSELVITTRP